MRRPSAKTAESVDVTSTSAILVADNVSRRDLILIPDGTVDVTLALAVSNGVNTDRTPTAVVGEGPVLVAGTPPLRLDSYTGPVAMVCGTTASVGVIEV